MAKKNKPIAWLHIMHMEFKQTNEVLSFSKENPFGRPGVDYSESYPVTSEPLYKHADSQT